MDTVTRSYTCNTLGCPEREIAKAIPWTEIIPGVLDEPQPMCGSCRLLMMSVVDPQPPFIDREGSAVSAPGLTHGDNSHTRSSSPQGTPGTAGASRSSLIAHKFEPDDDDEQEHCVVCGLLKDVGPGYVAHGFGVYGYGDEIVQIDPLVPPPVDLDAVKRSGARVPMTADQIETGIRAAAAAGLMLPHAYVSNEPREPNSRRSSWPACEWCGSPRTAEVHNQPAWDGQFRYEKVGADWNPTKAHFEPAGRDDGYRTAAQWDGLARYSDPAAAAFVQLLSTEDREAHERLHVALRFIGSQTNVASSQIIAVLEAAHRFFAGQERKANPLRVVAGIDVAKNPDDSVITLAREGGLPVGTISIAGADWTLTPHAFKPAAPDSPLASVTAVGRCDQHFGGGFYCGRVAGDRAHRQHPPKLMSIQQRPGGNVQVAQCKGFVPTTGFGNQKTCASCGAAQTAHQVRVQ